MKIEEQNKNLSFLRHELVILRQKGICFWLFLNTYNEPHREPLNLHIT